MTLLINAEYEIPKMRRDTAREGIDYFWSLQGCLRRAISNMITAAAAEALRELKLPAMGMVKS